MIRSELVRRTFRHRIASVHNVLRDVSGKTLQGVFYEEQLQRVKAPDVSPVLVLYKNRVKGHWFFEIFTKKIGNTFTCICIVTFIFT